jgi:SAM-dependent methyltransferase
VFGFLEKKSRVLPVQKTLRRAEKLALESAPQANPQVARALAELAPALRWWGRRQTAERLEELIRGRRQAAVTDDPVARRLLEAGKELRALQAEIRSSFDQDSADEEHFPSTIDPRIYHVQLLLDFLGELSGRRVLDAGCGKGRFARILKERCPAADVWGLDISEEMLRYVPEGIHTRQGMLTDLPFEDGWFDAVYAVESLEHAVEIEAAVGELCRVTRPEGRVFIIDKSAARTGRLETPPWEKWFGRRELERLLGRWCADVSSEPISYWADVPPDGLFLAWKAIR